MYLENNFVHGNLILDNMIYTNKKVITILIILLLGFISKVTIAQGSFCVFGGDITNSQTELNFTAGQCFYTFFSTDHYSVLEGVQQPYKKLDVTNINKVSVDDRYVVYPNPVNDDLTIQSNGETVKLGKVKIKLYSMQGVEVYVNYISSSQLVVNMSNFHSGMYLLKIYHSNTEYKTFKIIKK